jgi:hypothetical protein
MGMGGLVRTQHVCTYIHTYIHTYIYAYMHTCIHIHILYIGHVCVCVYRACQRPKEPQEHLRIPEACQCQKVSFAYILGLCCHILGLFCLYTRSLLTLMHS